MLRYCYIYGYRIQPSLIGFISNAFHVLALPIDHSQA